MDRLFASLDFYCERTDAGFWSEPVNALTNLLIVGAHSQTKATFFSAFWSKTSTPSATSRTPAPS